MYIFSILNNMHFFLTYWVWGQSAQVQSAAFRCGWASAAAALACVGVVCSNGSHRSLVMWWIFS